MTPAELARVKEIFERGQIDGIEPSECIELLPKALAEIERLTELLENVLFESKVHLNSANHRQKEIERLQNLVEQLKDKQRGYERV